LKRLYLEFSVIYVDFLATLSLYYGTLEFLNFFFTPRCIFLLSFLTLYPLFILREFRFRKWAILLIILLTALSFLFALHPPATSDIMGGFSLILSSSLLFYSLKDTLRELYSGLSFYLVGLFLLLAIGFLQILILLADLLDYYILCIGENCPPFTFMFRGEYLLFFLGLFALYPFLHRWEFRRKNP